MKHLKTFESIFDIFKSSNNKETRISLDEKEFANLCDLGYIVHNGEKIHINQEKFTDLIGGSIISVGHRHKICLKDIGTNTILKYALDSEIYHS